MSVAQLTAMGFSQEDAEKALQIHSTVEEAIDHLFSIASQGQDSEEIPADAQGVAELPDMTFSEEDARRALREADGSIESAVERLSASVPPENDISQPTQVQPMCIQRQIPYVQPTTDSICAANAGADDAADVAVAGGLAQDETIELSTGAEERSEVAETATEPHNLEASKRATPWDRAQMFLSQSMSTVRAHVSDRRQPEADSEMQPSSTLESVTSWLGDLSEEEAQEVVDDSCENPKVAKWHEMARKIGAPLTSRGRIVAESGTGDETGVLCPPATAACSDSSEAEMSTVHNGSSDDSGASPISAEHSATAVESSHQKAVVDAMLLDRAQVLLSQSVSALRSQVSGLLEPKHNSAPNSSSDAADEEASNSHSMSDQAVADIPVFHGESQASSDHERETQDSTDEFANAADDLTNEGIQQASDMGREICIEAKWHEMARRLGTAVTATMGTDGSIESPVPSASSNAAPDGASMSEPYHAQTFVNATALDCAQVFLSVSMSALRARASGVCVSNPVTVQ